MAVKKAKLSGFSIVILIIVAAAAAAALYYIHKAMPPVAVYDQGNAPTPSPVSPPVAGAQPNILNLPIPFTPQAPTANWDLLHNEACEEAAAIMANAYLTGDRETLIPPTRVESEISNLTVWQDQHFGYHLDTTAQETALMISSVYGLHATVQQGYTLQDIKDQINLHHVVILPVNGQVIGNPYYRQPGPIYHMLVIRGYSGSDLITDDSGTIHGENYPYSFGVLHNAGADWDHTTNTIDQSKKVMIIVSK